MKRNQLFAGMTAALMTAVLIIPFSSVIATTLTDVDGHKNQVAIEFLAEYNVVNGNPDGTYLPDNGVNRAELLKLLYETIGFGGDEPTEQCFPDVPLGEWYTKYVCAAKADGFIQGYPDGYFRPAQNVNKVEALKILAMLLGWDLSNVSGEPLFADTSADAWYAPYLQYAKKNNIIEYSGDLYYPADDMIRGEVAESIFRTAAIYYLKKDQYQSGDADTFILTVKADGTEQPVIILPATTTTTTTTTTTSTGACADPEAAIAVVETQLTDNHPQTDTLEIFLRKQPLVEGDTFVTFDGYGESFESTLMEGEEKWFFWVDLFPDAIFMHDTIIATVNTQDCYIEQHDSQLWPVVNDEALWSTDALRDARDAIDELIKRGPIRNNPPVFLPELFIKPPAEPTFGACNADVNARKRALIVYLSKDRWPKYSAIDMYNFLCSQNYVTTVITGDNSADVKDQIENALLAIEAASHSNGGYTNFFFYTISHGFKTGDLLVGDGSTRPLDALSLDWLSSKMGEIAYTNSTRIYSDSFTVVQDSCYSGNATAKHQAQAFIPFVRETAVGWIATSSTSDKVGWFLRSSAKSVYTNALVRCLGSIVPYNDFQACMDGEIQNQLSKSGKTQTPTMNKLTPITTDSVPFLP